MLRRIAGKKLDQEGCRAALHDGLPGQSRRARQSQRMVDWAVRARLPLLIALIVTAGRAQVLAPEEIRDTEMRALQQKYRNELKVITSTVAAHQFPYKFYFSRKLDLTEKEQIENDQRSVQFDRYQNRVVLKITGNYFASYSAELLKPEERARETYESVMLPLLQAAVQALDAADAPEAFAFEISHHVRRKMLGVPAEGIENVVLVLPKESAKRIVASSDARVREAAVLEGEAYLNAKPIFFWPRPEGNVAETAAAGPPADVSASFVATPAPTVSPVLTQNMGLRNLAAKVLPERSEQAPPARDSSPDAIKDLQKTYQPTLDRMVQELESQAHFVSYAPPTFIPFHNGIYLQVSVTTTLPQYPAGSQYTRAALAFDQHIAHLIRPVLACFKERGGDFDGIDFSTTVRFASGQGAGGSPLAVEFISQLKLLSEYAGFDSTGQQLIDASFVLINGERVSLILQAAESGSTAE